MVEKEEHKIYYIPENFLDQGRVFKGYVKTRFLVDAILLVIPVFLLSLLIPINDTNTKISVVVALCSPFFLLGVVGINGDPVSVYIVNGFKWRKSRKTMLFNTEPSPLSESPLEGNMSMESPIDQFKKYIEVKRTEAEQKKREENDLARSDIEFKEDEDLIGFIYERKEKTEEQPKRIELEEENYPDDDLEAIEFTIITETVSIDVDPEKDLLDFQDT